MSASSIPRFLLPQRGLIWRRQQPQALLAPFSRPAAVRHASSKASKQKPLTLAKPTKFVPPSHPSRLPRGPPRSYGGPRLTAEQEAAQQKKHYPNMMPPEGSFMHWFLHSTSIHLFITLGTLFSLAIFSYVTNFKRTSDFGDMLPPTSHIFSHPIDFFRTWVEVLKLDNAKEAARIAENRKNMVEDVVKRDEYRQAHNLNPEGFGGWTAKREDPRAPKVQPGETVPIIGMIPGTETPLSSPDAASPVAVEPTPEASQSGEQAPASEQRKKPLKKWLGIW